MAKQYNYSRVFQGPNGPETFSVNGADSFDEAKKIVDKGIYDRGLEVQPQPPQLPRQEGGPMNAPFIPSVPDTTAGGGGGNFPPTGK